MNRPISDQSKYQDTVAKLTATIFRARLYWIANYEIYTLEDCFSKIGAEKFDIHSREIEQYFQIEIRDKFDRRTESKLQDRYANDLWVELDGLLLTTFHYVKTDLIALHNDRVNAIPNPPDGDGLTQHKRNSLFLCEVHNILYGWCMVIVNALRIFAPELYLVHRAEIAKYINLQDDEGSLNANTQPQPTEPGVKLQWSCNPATAGFIIATLVEKGYINPPFKGDGTTNDTELARVCLQLFEFENASPSVDSMRRNLNLQSPNANQFSQDNREMFKIPHKSRLIQSNASRNSPNT